MSGNTHVVENITYTPEVEITNNTFVDTPTRGILVTTRKPVLIENNYFDGMGMSSIFISSDAHQWYESGPTNDVTIRNNVFDRSEGPVIYFGPTNQQYNENKPVHNNIVIENNKYDNGLNLRVNTSAMSNPANNVTIIGDDLKFNANNNIPAGGDVKYYSSNEEVLTVDENGVITAVGNGIANVVAYSEAETRAYKSNTITFNVEAVENPGEAEEINKFKDSNSLLESINVTGVEVLPTFESNKFHYIANGSTESESITLNIKAKSPKSKLIIMKDGEIVEKTEGSTYSGTINLSSGLNGIQIYSVSEDGISKSMYRVGIIRRENNDTSISNLAINGETIDGFDAENLSYIYRVSEDVESINISAVKNYNKSKMTIISGTEVYGENEGTISLKTGINDVYVRVVSENYAAESCYKVSVIRESKSNADLLSLDTPNNKLDQKFDPSVKEYTMTTNKQVFDFNAVAQESKAKIKVKINDSKFEGVGKIDGSTTLNTGLNTARIKVISEDESTVNEYVNKY